MSLIKANAVQIGQSGTATNNFTLAVPSSPDGTIKLARGNAGATTQDVLSVDASGNVNGLVKSAGSTTARSLDNRFADVVNVLDFGAVGDGVTNDTAAIQAALNNGENKSIYFPSGTYIISSQLTGPKNCTVYGDGWNTTIKVANNSNPSCIIKFGNNSYQISLEIRDIQFDGNKDNNPSGGDGIVIVRGYKANLFNVKVKNCKGDGIQYESSGTSFENYIYNISSYNNDGVGFRMDGTITDTHIFDSDIGYNKIGGVVLATSCSVNGSTIWGGNLPDCIGVITAGVSSQIVGNRIEGHGKYGIYVSANNDYMYIANNKIYANSFNAATTGLYDGIAVEANAGYGTIVGNKIYSSVVAGSPFSMRYAILFNGAHNQWTVYGNDLPLLTNPGQFKITGPVVYGILSTDKADFNWIRTNVYTQNSSNFTSTSSYTWVKLPFNFEINDTLNEFSLGTFIPKNSGMYKIEVNAVFTPAALNEPLGIAIFQSGGSTEINRLGLINSTSTSSVMVGGSTDVFLTEGVSYEIRYLTGNTSTVIQAGLPYTYSKIRAIAN